MSTTPSAMSSPQFRPQSDLRAKGHRLPALVGCLALLLVGACQGNDQNADSGRASAGVAASAGDAASAEEVFAALTERYPALQEPELSPEQEYGRLLAENEADLSGCTERADTGGTCPKPQSLHGDLKETVNVQLLLDASGSMAGQVGGRSKMAVARKTMLRFVDSLPEAANVSLRVFGHVGSNSSADRARSCRSSELVQPWVSAGSDQIRSAVRSFDPRGWTPLARSLHASLDDFQNAGGADASNFVYVISDGIETCGGDPVAAARRLGDAGIGVDVNIIGFDVDSAAQRQLRTAARAAHGTYTDARNAAGLARAFDGYDWDAWADYYRCKYHQANDDYLAIRNASYDNLICIRNAINDELVAVRNDSYDLALARRNASYDAATDINNWLSDQDGLAASTRDEVRGLVAVRHDQIVAEADRRHQYVLQQLRHRSQLIMRAANQHRTDVLVRAQQERDRIVAEANAAEQRHSEP